MTHSIHSPNIPSIQSEDLLPPVSRWTSLGGMILVGAIAVLTSLATITKYNVVVKADATIRPDGELRVVQANREGSIKQIVVQNNQVVRRGDIIAYLDDSQLQIQKSQLQGNVQQSQTQLDQVAAQIQSLDTQILAEASAIDRAVAAAQAELVRNQREHLERQSTTQADVQEAQVVLDQATDAWQRYQQLASEGAYSQLQLKEKETTARAAIAKLERAQASLNPTDASVIIAQAGIAQQQSRGEATLANLRKEREALQQRQAEIRSQMIRDQKELEQVERNLKNTVVQAAIDGTIFQLAVSNPNQVVNSGDNIAQIVPLNMPLVVKASVANQDIDQVKVGQKTQLRVEACPYSDYGTLNGVVQSIAPDTNSSQSSSSSTKGSSSSGNQDRNFVVMISLIPPAQPHKNTISLSNGRQQCQIQSGMQASAQIISEQETVLQFILRKGRLWIDL
jgi:HlyD family secretion protein